MEGFAVIVLCLVIDLIRELYDRVVRALRAGQLLAQDHGPGLDCRQVKAHVEVGRARASLHIEHLHCVVRVVLEDVLAALVCRKDLIQFLCDLALREPSRLVIALENIIERGISPAALHDPGPEVDRTGHGGMHAAQVEHQLAVHIEPEVVVAGELEDDVVSPLVQSARCLRELGFHLHAEEVIGFVLPDQVELLPFPGVCVRKCVLQDVRLVCHSRISACHEIVVRHELAVRSGGTGRCADRRELVIDRKVPAVLQSRKVRRTVVFEVSALVVDTL